MESIVNRFISNFLLSETIGIAPCFWRRISFVLSFILASLMIQIVTDPSFFLSCFLLGSVMFEVFFSLRLEAEPNNSLDQGHSYKKQNHQKRVFHLHEGVFDESNQMPRS